MWGANYFPNTQLTTHRGKQVRFFDDLIKDKVVAINFIYTKCTDACPMETARMVEVQKLLRDRLGKDVFFYSISIDPKHDTPEVLATYAENWKIGDGWTFLTGKEADITLLRKKFGVYDADLTKKDHNLSLVIGNQKTGRWMKRSPYENPYVLASQLGGWLHNWKIPAPEDRDYANAPELRTISKGEDFFRTRCAACHTIGEGDRTGGDGDTRIGPDLLDVAKHRDRDWLVRWVMHPDKMIEAKDPIALGLMAKYQNIVMPNLRLTEVDADNVLGYIEAASRAVTARRAAHSPKISAPVPGRMTASVRQLLTQYESLRARFAGDDLAGAQRWAAKIDAEATAASRDAGDAHEVFAEFAAAARRISTTQDIDRARLAFGDLSRNLIGVLVVDPALRDGHMLFQCPMAKGYQKWIQSSDQLDNPYWGKRMLTCGSQLTEWSI